jgi:hypothetical protein
MRVQRADRARWFKAAVIVAVVAAIAFGGAGGAAADTGPGETGGGAVGSRGVVPAQTASAASEATAKSSLAAAYFAYESGKDSLTSYLDRQQAFAVAYPGAGLKVSTPAARGTGAARLSAVALALIQHDQATDYYCGPSTAESIVQYLNGTNPSSRYDGASLSQANLASSTYLQTTASAGTSWASGRMPIALNLWTQGRSNGWYVNNTTPSISEFQQAAVYDIYAQAHPFANSTVELAGDPDHYNNHPVSKKIGHWVPAYGVSGPGDGTTYFADPAHSSAVSWGSLPAEYFGYASTSWTTNFLQYNGIVW